MFKNDIVGGTEVKRFIRYFYDPPPKNDDQSGLPIWVLGREYASGPPPKPVTTTDHDDVVEIASSSADSHNASDTTVSTAADSVPSTTLSNTSSFDDAQHVEAKDIPTEQDLAVDGGWPSAFLDDFESKIWMSYRSGFPSIPRSTDPGASAGMSWSVRMRSLAEREGFTSDTGWGCMIRSGQSLLANALITSQLGRDWRRKGSSLEEESKIISLFADDPKAPFSLHRFVQHGASACGKHPGQWFGPSAAASCIRELSSEALTAGLRVYVTANSSDVYEDHFRERASRNERAAGTASTSSAIQPTLILLGLRLGPDRITPVYYEALKAFFTYPQSIGIAGGRPSSSHYFIGFQGSQFFYLDPHETRSALPYREDPKEYSQIEIDTVHTRRLRSLQIGEMDPSMLVGFLIKDEDDWNDWKKRLAEVKGKGIIHIHDKEPPVPGQTKERKEAVNEVETFDSEDEEETVIGAEDAKPEELASAKAATATAKESSA